MALTTKEIKAWPLDEYGYHVDPVSNKHVKLGNYVKLGDYVTLGNGVKLGDDVKLGDGMTSPELAHQFRGMYAPDEEYVFTKWVTRDGVSPGWGSAGRILYEKGCTYEEPDALVNDQQCAKGLHVFRLGYRPEWVGLCSANHNYVPLKVAVYGRDICFAGLPGNDAKLRVRKLRVLDE